MTITTQPRIPSNYRLLTSGYDHGGLLLDLYGTFDKDGYEVVTVALASSTVDLWELVPSAHIESMTGWCNEHLPCPDELREESRQESRIDQWAGLREFVRAVA